MALLLIAILLRFNDGFWSTLGLAAVLGGTIGNLVDRILLGYVVDMFEPYFIDFAIFNIADIFIALGGITFLISFIASTIKPAKSNENALGDASAEYAPVEYPNIEDQIGLYDFQYGEDSDERDQYRYDDPDDNLISNRATETDYVSSASYSAPDPDIIAVAAEPSEDIVSALDALSKFELELKETGMLEDYDLDGLLREYGFDDDTD
jgi:hypothetical protein